MALTLTGYQGPKMNTAHDVEGKEAVYSAPGTRQPSQARTSRKESMKNIEKLLNCTSTKHINNKLWNSININNYTLISQ